MENGNYVTRAELAAHLTPIRDDVKDIRDDVKKLLATGAKSEGEVVERRRLSASTIAWCALFITIFANATVLAVTFHV